MAKTKINSNANPRTAAGYISYEKDLVPFYEQNHKKAFRFYIPELDKFPTEIEFGYSNFFPEFFPQAADKFAVEDKIYPDKINIMLSIAFFYTYFAPDPVFAEPQRYLSGFYVNYSEFYNWYNRTYEIPTAPQELVDGLVNILQDKNVDNKQKIDTLKSLFFTSNIVTNFVGNNKIYEWVKENVGKDVVRFSLSDEQVAQMQKNVFQLAVEIHDECEIKKQIVSVESNIPVEDILKANNMNEIELKYGQLDDRVTNLIREIYKTADDEIILALISQDFVNPLALPEE